MQRLSFTEEFARQINNQWRDKTRDGDEWDKKKRFGLTVKLGDVIQRFEARSDEFEGKIFLRTPIIESNRKSVLSYAVQGSEVFDLGEQRLASNADAWDGFINEFNELFPVKVWG